eukprot:2724382-Amphidinium_carterae.1
MMPATLQRMWNFDAFAAALKESIVSSWTAGTVARSASMQPASSLQKDCSCSTRRTSVRDYTISELVTVGLPGSYASCESIRAATALAGGTCGAQ